MKRDMIDQLRDEYPVKQLCEVLDCPRSSYYRRPPEKAEDAAALEAIEDILMQYPFLGYRRVHQKLLKSSYSIGEHRVRRLLKLLGGSRKVGKVRIQTTDSRHNLPRYPNRIKGVKASYPNQVWVADITYIRLGTQFIYLAVILDAYTRSVRGWCVSRSLHRSIAITALQQALSRHPPPFIFHSDQGSQYASWEHTELLHNACVYISMSAAGQPTENGLAERFMRTLKEEHVDYADYDHFEDACRQISHWLEHEYNTQREHSALAYLTPAEFEADAYARGRYPLLN